ncbi:hypothetical protein BN2476_110177 [Paraburkholderia piptadeniae]|uniref:Uncharacterized protein n=1 Tax=Paraburkholderia piptadeniae TaxID=1701573 RepID=A0A1N7RQA3_9BURK|nr:hypothetical protein BN2476_110177 [Paraburkholderia piptadeniae]
MIPHAIESIALSAPGGIDVIASFAMFAFVFVTPLSACL